MKASATVFTSAALAGRRSGDLRLAWLDAADDVHEAHLAWCQADRAVAADAFTVYLAALDREEAAARALQLSIKRRV